MSQVRLYLDEDAMRKSLVFGLRARNVDVLTATEADMINHADEAHLATASAASRALFTHNTSDFCALHQTLDYCRASSCGHYRGSATTILDWRRIAADDAAYKRPHSRANAKPARVPPSWA
jgi:hypothetical protein